MPLLISPIDGSPMRQISRYGIEIDVCPASGGIWLDKGEIEKLMAIIKEEAMNDRQSPYVENAKHEQEYSSAKHYRERDYDDDDDYHDKDYRRHGRKSKLSRIADIFDF